MIVDVKQFNQLFAKVYQHSQNRKIDPTQVEILAFDGNIHDAKVDLGNAWLSSGVNINGINDCWMKLIPEYDLVNALNYVSEGDDPEEISDTYRQHVDFKADDNTFKKQIKAWLDEDEDEAILEILRPLYFEHVKINDIDCVMTIE